MALNAPRGEDRKNVIFETSALFRDFHGMVQWETWDDTKTEAHKGSSL